MPLNVYAKLGALFQASQFSVVSYFVSFIGPLSREGLPAIYSDLVDSRLKKFCAALSRPRHVKVHAPARMLLYTRLIEPKYTQIVPMMEGGGKDVTTHG